MAKSVEDPAKGDNKQVFVFRPPIGRRRTWAGGYASQTMRRRGQKIGDFYKYINILYSYLAGFAYWAETEDDGSK